MVLPSSVFTIVLLVYLGLTSLVGGASGVATSRLLQLHWKPVVFLQDMAIAGVASLLFAFMVIEIEKERLTPFEQGEAHHSPWTLVFIGFAASIIRHLIRFVWRRANGTASQVK